MAEQGPTIKVRSGSNLIFSCSKQITDPHAGGKTASLVSSLKEAQVQVNQFLTELVEESGSSDKNEGGDEEASGEEDEEADEEADGEESSSKVSEAVKRKTEGNGSNLCTETKRTKSHT